MKCSNNYIKNPKTGKCVKKSGKIGKKIIDDKKKEKLLKNASVYSPKKYFEGLNYKESKKRLDRIKKGSKTKSNDPKAYKKFDTDFKKGKRIKTKQSGYTKQWNKYFPNAKSLEEKSKVSGVPLKHIKKVYDKGLAAWRTGHRPGANPQQWGYARVHSFLVKGKTYYTTDSYLAKEAIKTSPKAKKWFNSIQGLCDNKKKNPKWCK